MGICEKAKQGGLHGGEDEVRSCLSAPEWGRMHTHSQTPNLLWKLYALTGCEPGLLGWVSGPGVRFT